MGSVSRSSTRWRFILHGGCSETCPDPDRQLLIKRELRDIADQVSSALEKGMTCSDAVALAVSALEDCPVFNAGHGAALNHDGIHQLEAGIIDGASSTYGAVACMERTKNPIQVAHALMRNGPHTFLVGPTADQLALDLGMEPVNNEYFTTSLRKQYWEQRIKSNNTDDVNGQTGTVGAIVLDDDGNLAVGGSTGGPTGKMNGRIGDTAIIGAGLYADARIGVLCSGSGDVILKKRIAAKIAEYHAHGGSLADSIQRALGSMEGARVSCAVVAMDALGNTAVESTARLFSVVTGSATDTAPRPCIVSTTVPVLPPHEFFSNNGLIAGLTRYPTTPGQTIAVIKQCNDIFSLSADSFVSTFGQLSAVASVLSEAFQTRRCALVSTGGNSISLIPLHGLDEEWQAVTSQHKEYNETFPGHVSSMDGPKHDADVLDGICSRIQKISGITKPFNYHFDGPADDANLFARIIRGELQQWRVWEDDDFIAFLTPFANTPGFTVLIPRQHLSSDIFAIKKDAYGRLMAAVHTVGNILKQAFLTDQCGVIFEGFEVDYAHVKLIPIHSAELHADKAPTADNAHIPVRVTEFHETYQGHVSSLHGPLCKDSEALTWTASDLRKHFEPQAIHPPKSWSSSAAHLTTVLSDPWYENLFLLQDALFHTSIKFFQKDVGYKFCFVPTTTDAVSSPMGLGSDSQPVPISFLGQPTHLADSMQFSLEYFLRIKQHLAGVYYVNTSFRGEDPDAMHLNQFYHVECELLGAFSDGISIAERYIITLTSTLLKEYTSLLKTKTGSCVKHLEKLVEHYRSHGHKFPQITVDDALSLPMMDQTCWRYVLPTDPSKGRTLTRAGEVRLIEYFGGAVWLTEMDHLSVPFYQAFTDDTRNKALCADLLLGNGEVLGLGERHVSADNVLTALHEHEVPSDGYMWYTEIRKHQPARTTGWGMGVERFLAWVLQHDDIRDLTIIPRMKGYSFAP